MLRNSILLLLIACSSQALTQTTFKVDNFSKNYYGKVRIEDTTEVFSPGWVAIYDKKTNKELIKVNSEELAVFLENGKVIANMLQLPYGYQSVIIYEDFNFDGIKDFAIEDGHNSCYHGPSFEIYLADKKGFTFNKDFTRLAQEYCGMFQVDHKKKKIYTMTKSGCCWHQFSEFVIENNQPKAIKIEEDDYFNPPFRTITTKVWNGKKIAETVQKSLDLTEEGVKNILSFTVEKNNKEVVLFNYNDRILRYALIPKNGNVEFSYPLEIVYQKPDFKLDTSNNRMSVMFTNKDATYKVYEYFDPAVNKEKIGVEVNVNGEIFTLSGKVISKKGSLKELLKVKLDNVVLL